MSVTRIQTNAVAQFACLGDQCPDTCCKGWGMQLTQETVDKIAREAPELTASITSGEAEYVMRRDSETDYCVKFDHGWCAIHRDYGPEFLGDACHFYPRVTRAFDDTIHTSIALSCPEAARLCLYGTQSFAQAPRHEVRTPFSLRNYLPPELDATQAEYLHTMWVTEAGNPAFGAERNLVRLLCAAQGVSTQPIAQWPQASHFYLNTADARLPAAEAHAFDMVHLAQALHGLIRASRAPARAALGELAGHMHEAIGMRIDAQGQLAVESDHPERGLRLLHQWQSWQVSLQPVLRRYLQAQLSQALFPFAGFGSDIVERLVIIGVRMATLKLALMVEAQRLSSLSEADIVRVTYTLSRFLDHLADPAFSLAIYQETGWVRPARLRALLGDS